MRLCQYTRLNVREGLWLKSQGHSRFFELRAALWGYKSFVVPKKGLPTACG